MSLEKARLNPELAAQAIAETLMQRLGTTDIPFCFRTANGSVYASDRTLRTARYKASEGAFDDVSTITVFLDHKHLDDSQTDRLSEEYLANSPLIHTNSFLILHETGKDPVHVTSFDKIPPNIEIESLKKSLFFVLYDGTSQKVVKQAPVWIVPREGFHPIEFHDPAKRKGGHRNHIGNQIVNIETTNKKTEGETKGAIKKLALLSIK